MHKQIDKRTTMRNQIRSAALGRPATVSYWRKYVHEVLVNRLGGLSLARKSVVRLTDRPDMTDVYRGRQTTTQQQQQFTLLQIYLIGQKDWLSTDILWSPPFALET